MTASSDARGYVNSRDNLEAYRTLLEDLGLRDRNPFATLRDPAGPFETLAEEARLYREQHDQDDGSAEEARLYALQHGIAETAEAWDASLAERDADAINYVGGRGNRCAEPGL